MEDALKTEERNQDPTHPDARVAALWIDHDQAVILERALDDTDASEHLERSPAESEPAFALRTIHEIIDRDRIVVSGPVGARLGFERAYTAMTHRPDRLVDVEPTTYTSRPGSRTG
jgi:hypothetical protein